MNCGTAQRGSGIENCSNEPGDIPSDARTVTENMAFASDAHSVRFLRTYCDGVVTAYVKLLGGDGKQR